MCGRYALTATPEEILAFLSVIDIEDFPPRYNVAPTQPIPVVRLNDGQRQFLLMRWGLLPSWVKVICVDINPAVVTKLSDRGSTQTIGIVTDVGLFLHQLAEQLKS